MSNPANLKYTSSHEWVRVEADGSLTVGITHHAQELLGDMVFVEAPTIGRKVEAEQDCAVVESVKAASDIYAPVAGEITEFNSELDATPELLNQTPFETWIFKMKPDNADDVNNLLDADAYQNHVDQEAH